MPTTQRPVASNSAAPAIPGSIPTFVQATKPTYDGLYVWYQPQSDGTYKLFVEDGS